MITSNLSVNYVVSYPGITEVIKVTPVLRKRKYKVRYDQKIQKCYYMAPVLRLFTNCCFQDHELTFNHNCI